VQTKIRIEKGPGGAKVAHSELRKKRPSVVGLTYAVGATLQQQQATTTCVLHLRCYNLAVESVVKIVGRIGMLDSGVFESADRVKGEHLLTGDKWVYQLKF